MDRVIPGTSSEQQGVAPESLHAAAVAGDEQAREELARLCLPRVRRLVQLSVAGGPDSEDVAQTATARAFVSLESYRGEARFLVWVDRVTANVIKDHYRRKRWAVFQLFDEGQPSGRWREPERPDQEVQRNQVLQNLTKHIVRLRPKLRLPLVLSLVHGYTVPEIAGMLEIGREATKKRLLRGRRDLLERVMRDPVCRDALKDLGR